MEMAQVHVKVQEEEWAGIKDGGGEEEPVQEQAREANACVLHAVRSFNTKLGFHAIA